MALHKRGYADCSIPEQVQQKLATSCLRCQDLDAVERMVRAAGQHNCSHTLSVMCVVMLLLMVM